MSKNTTNGNISKNKSKNNIAVFKKILKYIKGYKWLFLLSTIFAAISSILSLYLPVLIGKAVDKIVTKGQVDFEGLFSILYTTVVIILISALANWLMNVLNNKITYAVVKDIRKDAFYKLQKLPLSYLDTHPSGETVNRIITGVDQFADGLLMGFSQFFTGVITIVGTLVFMITINVQIAILVVLITPLSLFVASFIAKKTHNLFEARNKMLGKETAYINEILESEKLVKAFAYEDEAVEEFNDINNEMGKISLKAVFYSSTTNPSTRFVNGLVYAAVALSGAMLVIKGVLTVGQLTSFLSYANQYTKPFNEISGVITELQNAITCAEMVFDLIEENEEIPDKENAVVLENVQGNINLDNVEFSYGDKPFIDNLNINVKQGQRIAIVGPTGCGKTTVINLLMRFYNINGGRITIDGHDITEISRDSLRKSFGMVLQETWLKSGTIKENIAMGRPDASDEEIIEAAKKAHAHSFINRLENGYDTVIGEDGGMLSGGQKQLICIARVMLCLPPMLILDEATSSIDTMTEIRIQKAFANLMEGRTSFIVAHRLSTIREADCILVMKDGHIIEQGNHDMLINNDGFYKELYMASIQ